MIETRRMTRTEAGRHSFWGRGDGVFLRIGKIRLSVFATTMDPGWRFRTVVQINAGIVGITMGCTVNRKRETAEL